MKVLKSIMSLIIILLILLLFFAVVRPVYMEYKQNKKQVVVDTSGERATSKNKVSMIEKIKNGITGDSDENSNYKISDEEMDEHGIKLKESEYTPFTFDDRILLYEGDANYKSINSLTNILIENIGSKTYSKPDVVFKNVNGIETSHITYDNEATYSSVLNEFKNSINQNDKYTVSFEYNITKTIANKIIIEKN